MNWVRDTFGVSERRACKVLDQSRSTQRCTPSPLSDEQQLLGDIVCLVTKDGRYGYRKITAILNNVWVEDEPPAGLNLQLRR